MTLDETLKLLQVSKLLVSGKTGEEVAKQLKVSPSTISRLKNEAKKQGILSTIQVVTIPEVDNLSDELRTKFNVEAFVAPEGNTNVGQLAKQSFEGWIRKYQSTVVLDGGSTIFQFIRTAEAGSLKGIEIVPIFSDPSFYCHSAIQLANRLSAITDAKVCHLPFLCSPTAQQNRKFLELRSQAQLHAKNSDIVFLGCGPWEQGYRSTDFFNFLGLDSEEIRNKYPQVSAVTGYLALDEDGNEVQIEELENDRLCRALSYTDLQEMSRNNTKHIALLADTPRKSPAIRVILKAGLVNSLFVNEETAIAILRGE